MRTPAELAALEAAAAAWEGTPFCANSAVRGGGVCCHRLCAAIYSDAGWVPALTVPAGSPTGQGRAMVAWLDGEEGRRVFARVSVMEPGDLVGFRIHGEVRHLGVILPGFRMAHSTIGPGATIAPNIPKPWARRLGAIWRPL